MCATEEFIRASAARGLSKTATAAALGVSYRAFLAMLDVLPGIEWPARHQSLDRKLSDEARRGVCSDAQRRNLATAARALKDKHAYTVRGVRGTIPELVERFKVNAATSTVRHRLRRGLSIEAALFSQPTPPALRKTRPLSAWEAVDAAFEGQPAPQCM